MTSVINRIIIEEYEDSYGCPQYDLMGYDNLMTLMIDVDKHIEYSQIIKKGCGTCIFEGSSGSIYCGHKEELTGSQHLCQNCSPNLNNTKIDKAFINKENKIDKEVINGN